MIMERVKIYKAGSSSNGRVIALGNTLSDLLSSAGQKLGISAKKVFTIDGFEMDDIDLIRDNDVLFILDGDTQPASENVQPSQPGNAVSERVMPESSPTKLSSPTGTAPKKRSKTDEFLGLVENCKDVPKIVGHATSIITLLEDKNEKKDQQITQLRMEMGLRSTLADFINLICPDWLHLTTLSRRQKLRTSLAFGLTIFAQKIEDALWKKGYGIDTLIDGIVELYGEESDRHHERIILPKLDDPEFEELCEKLKINDQNKACLQFVLSEMQSSKKASFSGIKKSLIWVHLSDLLPQIRREASSGQIEQAIITMFRDYGKKIVNTVSFTDDKQKFEGTVTIMLQRVCFSDTAKIRKILNEEKSTYTHMTYNVKFHETK